jgi:UDP-N-acetylglucosamine diphosphorylase/glucosamine-1-phosphate N-acetyltransferase
LKLGECIKSTSAVLAVRLNEGDAQEFLQSKSTQNLKVEELSDNPVVLDECWKIFQFNGLEISQDLIRMGVRPSKDVPGQFNKVLGSEIYIESGVRVNASTLNATTGPIYLGKGSEIMEGSQIRGPFALGEGATVKMGAKIYGDTTIGPHCKVGGELSNVVMFAYSNKGHDGFIGNSVIGEWCNFGADTNSSNLKNNYSPVRIWSYSKQESVDSNLQFCGLIAGDHVKTGINTMLNTATVLGVSANVFGADFPKKFIPSFSWGGARKMDTFKLNKAYEVAESMMKRRGVELSDYDKQILEHIFLADSIYRK